MWLKQQYIQYSTRDEWNEYVHPFPPVAVRLRDILTGICESSSFSACLK